VSSKASAAIDRAPAADMARGGQTLSKARAQGSLGALLRDNAGSNHMMTRSTALLRMAAATALVVTAAASPPAYAVLERVGPNLANGFPAWYQDRTGLSTEFCSPSNASELAGGWCVLFTGDTVAPEVFPTAFADEHFYYAADALDRRVPNPAVPGSTLLAFLRIGLEGAFLNGPVVNGDQMVFARLRIKLTPLPYDGTYTVYTPAGVFVFPDQLASDPRGLFFTEDVGLSAGVFTDALNGDVGPFLLPSAFPGGPEMAALTAANPTPDTDPAHFGGAFAPTPYPGTGKSYLGDPARVGPVTGSTLPDFTVGDGTTRNANIFRIEGPNGFVFETTDFGVRGRVFTDTIPGRVAVDRASYARTATLQKVDVFATGTETTQGRLPTQPRPASVAPSLSFFEAPCGGIVDPITGTVGPPFTAPTAAAIETQMVNTGSNYWGQALPAAIPAEVCVHDAAARDATGVIIAGGAYFPRIVADEVTISQAAYDPVARSLTVTARSSDEIVPPTLILPLPGAVGTPSPATWTLSPIAAPPAKVQVLSSALGTNTYQVTTGTGTPAGIPVAVNDAATTLEDTPVVIGVLANDTNAAGGTVSLVAAPALGTAVVNADGSVTYTPNLDRSGADSFTYSVTIGTTVSNVGNVSVTITPVNDPPAAIGDVSGALRGFPNSVNVLANDTDPDGAADLASAVIVTGNANLGITAGTIFAGGVVTFTPPATAVAGVYTFTYNAVDRSGAQSVTPALVTVSVASAEVIVPAKAIYTQNKARWVVSGTDSPGEGQTLTIRYVDGTYKVNGACTGNAAGTSIGSAVVDSLGNWVFDQALTSTTGAINPSNTLGNSAGFWCTPPKSVRMTSSLSGASATFPLSLK
jgi:Bacterial Ig domain